jgi:SAM-dependent methyltransferase
MLSPDIMEYYQRGGELTRLDAGQGRLEFLRTWDVLSRVLPKPPARILDVGGATGVYAGPLAAAGYDVCVIDPLPEHVETAGHLPGVTAIVGDARRLPAEDATADAVLLLGPLYHLDDPADRVTAWREAARVARPSGVVVGAVISRFASMFDGLVKGYFTDPSYAGVVEGALADGRHQPGPDQPWFTSAYFHGPAEPAAEAAAAGLTDVRTVLVEGPLWMIGSRLPRILADDQLTATMLDMLRRVEADPSLFGASSHLLTVARAPGKG